jgi:N-acetylglucosamine-6-phosphate deacetylase
VKIPLPEAIAMASTNSARALGSKTKGKLEVGGDADFVVLSPELKVLQTFVAGEEIYRKS